MESTRGELLQIIHKTGTYGVKAVRAILPRICHSELRAEVEKHGVWYQTAAKKAEHLLYSRGLLPREENGVQKMTQWCSLKMSAIKNLTPSKAAEMMVLGCTMGLIEMHSVLNHQQESDEEAEALASDVMQKERDMIECMCRYL